jgi:hypothetical protein
MENKPFTNAELDSMANQVDQELAELTESPALAVRKSSSGKMILVVPEKQRMAIEKAIGEPADSFWQKYKQAARKEGVWARAPYLYNGSVPTLADLLNAPAARPAVFYRGYDVYDQEKVGFVHEGPDAERVGYRFNTAERGNSNAGHTHGTQLSPDDKRALIEFLKTL